MLLSPMIWWNKLFVLSLILKNKKRGGATKKVQQNSENKREKCQERSKALSPIL